MHLDISDEQSEALRQLLDSALSDLNMEISHTDNPRFREVLRDHRESLRAVHAALITQPVDT